MAADVSQEAACGLKVSLLGCVCIPAVQFDGESKFGPRFGELMELSD